ncbi:hypothetical protein EON65_19530 [archaeon]|nr:MAG: hypothetical protein EON65_19530 [archaeon]
MGKCEQTVFHTINSQPASINKVKDTTQHIKIDHAIGQCRILVPFAVQSCQMSTPKMRSKVWQKHRLIRRWAFASNTILIKSCL